MPSLSLKPSHKPIKNYYEALDGYAKLGVVHEGAVLSAFQQFNQIIKAEMGCACIVVGVCDACAFFVIVA